MSDANNSPLEPAHAPGPPSTDRNPERGATRWWWFKTIIQPALFLLAGVILLAGLGIAQKLGWISAGGGSETTQMVAADGSLVRYICPMMCTPPQAEPGRCPVCAMELMPAAGSNRDSDRDSVEIDPVARRVANIRTVSVKAVPLTRRIRAIGELSYDEGTLKTLSAYVDGRLEQLYADYTGVLVTKGDHLALLYSPPLYSAQTEFLLAKKSRDQSRQSTLTGVVDSGLALYESARQRLIEFGMTEQQVSDLESKGEADSRLRLCAPISGTVIEKLANEGQYVKEGQPIYRLADLSTLWLMLELFPEDAAVVHYGQRVEAELQSFPGRKFTGRVAFIDPDVDPGTRTVGVRVVIPNPQGILRVGDYAKATIETPVAVSAEGPVRVYDPELANKWISPRHPHVIADSAGCCPICAVELVPAAEFGFTDTPLAETKTLVLPRSAVLMAGSHSVVYVETQPGRFELRRVVPGPSCGEQIAILSGVREGEQVAVQGNFLIDSQMQLAGNPSLIDPAKVEASRESKRNDTRPAEVVAALSALNAEDRALAEQQRICPVTEMALGSMGTPPKVEVNGRSVFLCCEGCRARLLAEPVKYLAKLPQEVAR